MTPTAQRTQIRKDHKSHPRRQTRLVRIEKESKCASVLCTKFIKPSDRNLDLCFPSALSMPGWELSRAAGRLTQLKNIQIKKKPQKPPLAANAACTHRKQIQIRFGGVHSPNDWHSLTSSNRQRKAACGQNSNTVESVVVPPFSQGMPLTAAH